MVDESKKAVENLHEGHRARMRKRFLKTGFEGMDDHVVLEMLLFYAIPRADTNLLAHRLINRFSSLHEVFNATYLELTNIEGVGENTAVLITMIPKLLRLYLNSENEKYRKKRVTYDDIGQFAVNALTGETVEAALLICLKADKIVHDAILARGDRVSVDIRLRDLTRIMLEQGCDAIAVAHLHLCDNINPTPDDIRATRNIQNAISNYGVRLIEHFIVHKGKYYGVTEYLKQ